MAGPAAWWYWPLPTTVAAADQLLPGIRVTVAPEPVRELALPFVWGPRKAPVAVARRGPAIAVVEAHQRPADVDTIRFGPLRQVPRAGRPHQVVEQFPPPVVQYPVRHGGPAGVSLFPAALPPRFTVVPDTERRLEAFDTVTWGPRRVAPVVVFRPRPHQVIDLTERLLETPTPLRWGPRLTPPPIVQRTPRYLVVDAPVRAREVLYPVRHGGAAGFIPPAAAGFGGPFDSDTERGRLGSDNAGSGEGTMTGRSKGRFAGRVTSVQSGKIEVE